MLPSSKRWHIAPPISPWQRARLAHLHPLLAQILVNRNVNDSDGADAFLNGRVRFDDPRNMRGIPEAVERLRAAIRTQEPIVVYGDFDADGVTATALLVQALAAFGANVRDYIPHRVDEGYGLNCDALRRLADEGARLVVTVDCGIRSVAEVAYGNALGLDIIVTDHHTIQRDRDGQDILPPALAVINPKQQADAYPFKDFAGVGLAFKLAQALSLTERDQGGAVKAPALEARDLLDLVALGTVADLAPLLGENRALVQRGLAVLNTPKRAGIQAMMEEAALAPGKVDATAIGFVLGPRINAAGRLDSAQLSYRLLVAADLESARPLAHMVALLNRQRQEKTQQLVDLARQRIEAELAGGYLYLVADRQFHPGIVGLVAGRLAEEYYRPVLVAEVGDEETHGSARSIPDFNITEALDHCRDLLVRHGGHAAAAGFTVRNENLAALRDRLAQIAFDSLAGKELAPALAVDAEASLADFDYAFVQQLAQLEPCGQGNAQPVFASRGLEVVSARQVGADRKHLKLMLRDPETGGPWDAIAFRMGEWCDKLPSRIDVAYAVEFNQYNDRQGLQLNVKDIRAA